MGCHRAQCALAHDRLCLSAGDRGRGLFGQSGRSRAERFVPRRAAAWAIACGRCTLSVLFERAWHRDPGHRSRLQLPAPLARCRRLHAIVVESCRTFVRRCPGCAAARSSALLISHCSVACDPIEGRAPPVAGAQARASALRYQETSYELMACRRIGGAFGAEQSPSIEPGSGIERSLGDAILRHRRDVRLGQTVKKGLSWFVEVRNLTDRTYAATTGVSADARGASPALFNPGLGRSVFAGIEWRQ